MAGKLSSYGELVTLNSLMRERTVYMGLACAIINKDSKIQDVSEVTDTGYSRKQITSSTPIQEGGIGTIKNSERVEFGPWNAQQLNPITHVFITEQASGGGEIIAYAALGSSKTPHIDELVVLRENDLVIKVL